MSFHNDDNKNLITCVKDGGVPCGRSLRHSSARTRKSVQQSPVTDVIESCEPQALDTDASVTLTMQARCKFRIGAIRVRLVRPNDVGSKADESTVKGAKRERDTAVLLMSAVRSTDWSVALEALQNVLDTKLLASGEFASAHMPEINQRLIGLLQSPRSHVCRTACQMAGQFFVAAKDTRKPEFDDIVELLLSKTADANKFIRIDANVALDSMVSSVSPFHSIRIMCNKGTVHKNDLVRVASARLLTHLVELNSPDLILGHGANPHTRKRIVSHMDILFYDRNVHVRYYAEKLYKILQKHANFQIYVTKSQRCKTDAVKKILDKCNGCGDFK